MGEPVREGRSADERETGVPSHTAPKLPNVDPRKLDARAVKSLGLDLGPIAAQALQSTATVAIDEFDPFLAARLSAFTVRRVGTHVLVTLATRPAWTARYTERALSEAATAATATVMFGSRPTVEQVKKVYADLIGGGALKLRLAPDDPVKKRWRTEFELQVDAAALTTLETRLAGTAGIVTDTWAKDTGLARMLAWGIDEIAHTDRLEELLPPEQLQARKLSVAHVRQFLTKRREMAVEIAKKHDVTAPWRQAFRARPELVANQRPPRWEDFPPGLELWGRVAVELTDATRRRASEQVRKDREADARRSLNEYLSPKPIEVADTAKFVASTYDDAHAARLDPLGWEVVGGQQWTTIKRAPIFVLAVADGRVIYQNLDSTRFFAQTLEGFAQEQMYSVYAEAGRKSLGAIAITKFVLSLAGDIFPVVRVGLIATEVLHVAGGFQRHRGELEAAYRDFATAYRAIDAIIPGLLPGLSVRENLGLFSPLAHPDAVSWCRSALRLALVIASRRANAQLMTEAGKSMLGRLWKAFAHAAGVVIDAGSVLFPGVAGSAGASLDEAEAELARRLSAAGLTDPAAVARRYRGLDATQRQRLVAELAAVVDGGSVLVGIVQDVLSW